MAAPKRTRFQRELDLARIAAMFLEQRPQTEIAKELGLVQSVISRDLAEVKRRWRMSSLIDINEAKQRELARIDALESEYWQAWERSCHERVKTRTEQEGQAIKAIVTREQRDGNPAFLNGIQNCIEQRCKILGIYEAIKISLDWHSAVEAQGLDAGEIFEAMVNVYEQALTNRTATSGSRRKPRCN